MRKRVVLVAAGMSLCLAACNTYPPIVASAGPSPAGPFDVGPAVTQATTLRSGYVKSYEQFTTRAWWAPLPTIAAAGAAAGLLIANPANVANLVGYLGVAAGTYELGRNAVAPKRMPQLYGQAIGALDCILAEAYYFTPNVPQNSQTETPLRTLEDAASALRDQIVTAERWQRELIPDGGTAQERAAAQGAQRALGASIVEARGLLTRAGEEIAAGNMAGPVLASAVSAVQTRVLTKGLEGRSPDFQAALDQLKPNIPKPAESAQSTEGTSSKVGPFTKSVEAANAGLVKEISKVNAAMRPYKDSLERARACPNAVVG